MPMKSTDSVPRVVPTGGGLGAEIRGVELRRLGDEAFGAIHRAWLDNLVLLFRGQYRRRATQDGSANAEPERMRSLGAEDNFGIAGSPRINSHRRLSCGTT